MKLKLFLDLLPCSYIHRLEDGKAGYGADYLGQRQGPVPLCWLLSQPQPNTFEEEQPERMRLQTLRSGCSKTEPWHGKTALEHSSSTSTSRCFPHQQLLQAQLCLLFLPTALPALPPQEKPA